MSKQESLPSETIMQHYNKLNRIINETQYPWDLREQMISQSFVPTYKNITLYYKDTKKLLTPPKPKKGGSAAAATLVFYM
jgi:hypothetical protein